MMNRLDPERKKQTKPKVEQIQKTAASGNMAITVPVNPLDMTIEELFAFAYISGMLLKENSPKPLDLSAISVIQAIQLIVERLEEMGSMEVTRSGVIAKVMELQETWLKKAETELSEDEAKAAAEQLRREQAKPTDN